MPRPRPAAAIVALVLVAALAGCGSGGGGGDEGGGPTDGTTTYAAPWPADVDAVLAKRFTDPAGDQVALPPEMAGTPYSAPVPHPPVDVTAIELGVDDGFLYMRVTFAGPIPAARVHVAAAGEVEEQWVDNQGMNVAFNVDGDAGTGGGGEGVDGIDIFFALGFEYGVQTRAYANYGFPEGDLHLSQGQVLGEVAYGGPGETRVLVRYPVDGLGGYFPLGQPVELGSWSEAESVDAAGHLLYHHFAFDLAIDGGAWTLPAP